jgi:hypothetical protein
MMLFLFFVWSMNVSTAVYWVCIACHCVFETIISFKYSRDKKNSLNLCVNASERQSWIHLK